MGEMLEKTGNNVWIGALTSEGAAYGPDWKTLVLQVSSPSFPSTIPSSLFHVLHARKHAFFSVDWTETENREHSPLIPPSFPPSLGPCLGRHQLPHFPQDCTTAA